MRIAHVTDCYLPRLGGIELQVHDLAVRQAAAGHQVTVLTTTVGVGDGVAPDGVEIRRLGGSSRDADSIRYLRSARGRAVVASGFDVVHVHASSFSPLSFLAAHQAARAGVPTVATVHSLWAKATPLFVTADRLTGWADWPVAWSAVSDAAAAPLRRVLRGRADVAVLPNGIDADAWSVTPEPRPAGTVRMAAVCRLASRKRPLQLARTLRAARRRLPESVRLTVEIIGDGPERPRLERYLQHHGMAGWVHLCGRLTRAEIRSIYARTDLFLAPAKLESFGIAALEARSAGVPIVALAGTGVASFVRHDHDGWIVESDQAMTERIVSLSAHRETLDRVTAHNRTTPPGITWASVLTGCEELYRVAEQVQGGGRPALSAAGADGRHRPTGPDAPGPGPGGVAR